MMIGARGKGNTRGGDKRQGRGAKSRGLWYRHGMPRPKASTPRCPASSLAAGVRTGLTASPLILDPAQQAAWGHLAALQQALAARPVWSATGWRYPSQVPQGAYLFGPVGRGKSMLMQQFFASLPTGFKKRRVHFHEFMEELHHRLHHTRPGPGADLMATVALALAADAQVLCFDEFFVTNIADAILLGRLLEALFRAGVVLCATSNWPLAELYQEGHNRGRFQPFIKILQQHLTPIDLGQGQDYRTQAAPPADCAPATLFKTWTGQAAKAKTVSIAGQRFAAQGWAKGILWADFNTLCTQALGRAEYLACLPQWRGVMITNVPSLGPHNADAALRLVVLIDLLYEAQTPLRLYADQPLANLCPTGPLALAYARALSRVQQLQVLGLRRNTA